jgi:nitrous oxidase accessory protein NosD
MVRLSTAAALAWLALAAPLAHAQEREPRGGPPPGRTLRIEGSIRLPRGSFLRPAPGAPGARAPVLLAEDLSDVTIDLRGVVLRGAPEGTPLDASEGWCLLLRRCRGVRVRGGTFAGYKGCIVAEDCAELAIEGASFEGYYGQRLGSNDAFEDESDWLWPHENDRGEWLERYGAAISLTRCTASTVSGCRARRGQNGLLLSASEGTRVFDNDFSFLSGWGLALYRASHNVITKNRFDYCVRGYSHGVYWRGQDSAGILMFERSSDNVIAYNSATHGGDGVFLYGGHDIVEGRATEPAGGGPPEAGAGGSDRNLFFRNDLSYAVANGIEATFSRDNRVLENVAVGCHQHGLWGGYSRGMVVAGNTFEGTLGPAISIEHGQECLIARNVLHDNEVGLELWWDEDPQFVQGPFGRHFDTASRDHWIVANSFAENGADLVVRRSQRLVFQGNVFTPEAGELVVAELTLAGAGATDPAAAKRLLAGVGGWMPSGTIEGSSLREPPAELHPALEASLHPPEPEVHGRRELGPRRGSGLESIVIGEWGPWDFEGGEPRPPPRKSGGALAGVRWSAAWFSWRDGPDPRAEDQLERWRALAEKPLEQAEVEGWNGPWAGLAEVRSAVGNDRFGLIARARVELEPGRYRLSAVSDDGVRVRLDGKTVLENWSWHASTRDEARLEIAGGEHELLLEYFQIDGGAALSLDLKRE